MRSPPRSWPAGALGILAIVALAGCQVDRLAMRADPPPTAPLPAELAAGFAYEKKPVEPRVEALESTEEFEKTRGRFDSTCPVSGAPTVVTFEMWRTKLGAGPRPVVVIIPILAGRYPECDALGQLMARNGMHAFFVHREDNLLAFAKDAGEPFETKLRRSIVNIRRTLDWVSARPDVAADRVGLVGISLGAIAGSIVMAVEPRIRRGVLIMGGGDMPGIVSDSIETPVRRYKIHKMLDNGWTEEEFKASVAKDFPSDPLIFAPYVGAGRVQQWITKYDNKVPTRYQWKLWEALGRPEGFAVPIGHYTSILYLGYAKREAMSFMRRGLLDEPELARPGAPHAKGVTPTRETPFARGTPAPRADPAPAASKPAPATSSS